VVGALVGIAWYRVGMVGLDAGLVVFCDARVYERVVFCGLLLFGLGAMSLCVHVIPAAVT
jgi:hypothetical protein